MAPRPPHQFGDKKTLRTSDKTLTPCAVLVALLFLTACTTVNLPRNGASQSEVQGIGGLSAASETAIVDALVRDGQLDRACVNQQASSGDLVEVQAVDLNADESPEYVVEGLHTCACGAQRCYYWVYANQQNRLKLLAGVEANFLEAGRTRTNGFRDLIVYNAYGGRTQPIVYKFDGASYAGTSRTRK